MRALKDLLAVFAHFMLSTLRGWRCGETLTGLFSHTCSYASVPAHFTQPHCTKARNFSQCLLLYLTGRLHPVNKARVGFEPDVRSWHASLQVNEWQIYFVVFPCALLSARLMTRLHNTGFTCGKWKRVQTSAVMLLAHNDPPSGLH